MKIMYKKYKINNQQNAINGFTLIELLLYIGLLVLFIGVATTFILGFMETKAKNNTIVDVEEQGTFASRLIGQTLRNATSINSPSQGTTATSLSINTYDPAKTPTLFDLSGGAIRMKEGSGAYINLTNTNVTITNLTFSNLSRANTPGVIKYQFTVTYINPDSRNVYDFEKTFYQSASLRKK